MYAPFMRAFVHVRLFSPHNGPSKAHSAKLFARYSHVPRESGKKGRLQAL